jgi:hypothetical protein
MVRPCDRVTVGFVGCPPGRDHHKDRIRLCSHHSDGQSSRQQCKPCKLRVGETIETSRFVACYARDQPESLDIHSYVVRVRAGREVGRFRPARF